MESDGVDLLRGGIPPPPCHVGLQRALDDTTLTVFVMRPAHRIDIKAKTTACLGLVPTPSWSSRLFVKTFQLRLVVSLARQRSSS